MRLRLMLEMREEEDLVEAAVLFVRPGASLEPEASEASESCRDWVQLLGRAAALCCDMELEAVIDSEKECQQWGSAGLM